MSSVQGRRSVKANAQTESYAERVKQPDAETLEKIEMYKSKIANFIRNKNMFMLDKCIKEIVMECSNSVMANTLYIKLRMDIIWAQVCLQEYFEYRTSLNEKSEKMARGHF